MSNTEGNNASNNNKEHTAKKPKLKQTHMSQSLDSSRNIRENKRTGPSGMMMDDDIHDGDALDDNIEDDTNVVIEAEVEGEHIDDIELENTYTLVSLT